MLKNNYSFKIGNLKLKIIRSFEAEKFYLFYALNDKYVNGIKINLYFVSPLLLLEFRFLFKNNALIDYKLITETIFLINL